jgi:hypothetical protein
MGQPRFRGFSTDVALDIVQAMDHPGLFKQWFDGPSWDGWRAVLKAAFCLPMSEAEIAFFKSDPFELRPADNNIRRTDVGGAERTERTAWASSQQSPPGAFLVCRS